MKTIILILAFCFQLSAQNNLLLLFDSGVSYETETLTYQARVEADGGEVKDIDAVNSFYIDAKANDYLDTLICALIMGGGVKSRNDSVMTWYDLTANENDFTNLDTEPTNFSPLYSATNGIGGNTAPQIQATLTYNQPSAYYAIVKRTGKTGYEYFWGAVGNHALLQDGASRKLYMHGGSDFTTTPAYTNDTFELYRAIYSGATSSAQINNGVASVGNAGTTNVTAADFTLFNTVTDTYFKCFIISPRLSTAKDLNLKTILNTLYPTY